MTQINQKCTISEVDMESTTICTEEPYTEELYEQNENGIFSEIELSLQRPISEEILKQLLLAQKLVLSFGTQKIFMDDKFTNSR